MPMTEEFNVHVCFLTLWNLMFVMYILFSFLYLIQTLLCQTYLDVVQFGIKMFDFCSALKADKT